MGRGPKVMQGRIQSEDQLLSSMVDKMGFDTAASQTHRHEDTKNQGANTSNTSTSQPKHWKCKCDPDASTESSFGSISHWDDLLFGNSKIKEEFRAYRLHDGSNLVYLLLLFLFIILTSTALIALTTAYPQDIQLTKFLIVYFLVALFLLLALTILKVSSLIRYFLYDHGKEENSSQPNLKKNKRSSNTDETSTVASMQHHLQQVDPKVQAVHRASCLQGYLEALCSAAIIFGMVLQSIYLVVINHEYENVEIKDLPTQYSLPEGHVAASVFIPILLYMVLKQIHFRYAIFLVVSAFTSSMVLSGIYDLRVSLPRGIIGVCISLFILCENHRQCWHSFSISNRLMKILDENARLAEEVKANELRHMIGNVAHDLKTPLSSFISGMEVIRLVADELQVDMNKANRLTASNITDMKEKISTILEVAENVTNTNAFMIMTINRCIDYNKTLFGLKLLPKIDAFILKDTIDFIVKCLQGLHSDDALVIDCFYKSKELRKGEIMIKTDKQWMQENLLCLIGNAVKYTPHDSKVIVELSVVPRNQVSSLDLGKKQSSTSTAVLPNMINGSPNRASRSVQMSAGDRSVSMLDIEEGSSHNDRSINTELFQKEEIQQLEEHDDKFMPMVKDMSTVSLASAAVTDSLLKVEVIDAGPGVDSHFRSKLFQEPVQAARLNGGTGLGLYSLAKRIETLGGEYGIQDRPDGRRGSLFWFTIPFSHHSSNALLAAARGNDMLWQAPSIRARPDLVLHESTTTDVVAVNTGSNVDVSRNRANSVNSDVPSSNSSSGQYVVVRHTAEQMIVVKPVSRSGSESSSYNGDHAHGEKALGSSVEVIECTSEKSPQQEIQKNATIITTPTPVPVANLSKIQLPEHLKVLVVDDSVPILKMTSLALRKQGHHVVTAENGLEAIKVFQDHLAAQSDSHQISTSIATQPKRIDGLDSAPFDVVLMDFQMPVMDGVQAIAKLRELERQQTPVVKILSPRPDSQAVDRSTTTITCKEAIIIGFSAKSDEYQIEEGYLKGMDAFLPKPFTISSFQSILTNLREQQQQEQPSPSELQV